MQKIWLGVIVILIQRWEEVKAVMNVTAIQFQLGFEKASLSVKTTMANMANSVIDSINRIIEKIATIPGIGGLAKGLQLDRVSVRGEDVQKEKIAGLEKGLADARKNMFAQCAVFFSSGEGGASGRSRTMVRRSWISHRTVSPLLNPIASAMAVGKLM